MHFLFCQEVFDMAHDLAGNLVYLLLHHFLAPLQAVVNRFSRRTKVVDDHIEMKLLLLDHVLQVDKFLVILGALRVAVVTEIQFHRVSDVFLSVEEFGHWLHLKHLL